MMQQLLHALIIAIYIATGVLLPIIPAYILYKALPSHTKVSGPFRGLNIRLTGAFGGYFLLVLIVFAFVLSQVEMPKPPIQAKPSDYELWTVQGKIKLEQGDFDLKEDTVIAMVPPDQALDKNGRFLIQKLPLEKQLGTKKPQLTIQREGYDVKTITLEEKPPKFEKDKKYDIVYQRDKRNIIVNTVIFLEKKKPKKDKKPYEGEKGQKPQKEEPTYLQDEENP